MVAATKVFSHHKNLRQVTRSELRDVPTPQATDTYSPVSFDAVWTIFEEAIDDVAVAALDEAGLEMAEVELLVSADEKLFRGTRSFLKRGEGFGVRLVSESSHNKRTAVRFGIEGLVEVCSNGMCLPGFVKASAKRHVPRQVPEIREAAHTGIDGVQHFLQVMTQDRSMMMATALSDDAFLGFMGRLWGHKVIGSNQLNDCASEWAQPRHAVFERRDLWSAYNAVTEVLKSVPLRSRESRYVNLHELAMSEVQGQRVQRFGGDANAIMASLGQE